jgi:predicted nucleotidyltransferase
MRQSGRVSEESAALHNALGVVDELSAVCRSILAEALVAVVLHGSLATGDFVASRSDVDLLVITEDHLTNLQRTGLANAVAAVAERRDVWTDVRVVTREAARRPAREPSMELYVGRHRDVPGGIEIEHGPSVEADLLFEFSICLEHGRSQTGPTPRELIGQVPLEWMLDVGDGYLERWQEIEYEEEHAELMTFTACRLWRLHDEGRHASKSDAAEWVLSRHPRLVAPKVALERRARSSNQPLEHADVMSLLATVRRILAAGPTAGGAG